MGLEIAVNNAQTEMSRPQDVPRLLSVVATLTGLAEARQAAVSDKTLELYAYNLSEFADADVRAVARMFARRKRAEGETAFPSLGELTEPLDAMRR